MCQAFWSARCAGAKGPLAYTLVIENDGKRLVVEARDLDAGNEVSFVESDDKPGDGITGSREKNDPAKLSNELRTWCATMVETAEEKERDAVVAYLEEMLCECFDWFVCAWTDEGSSPEQRRRFEHVFPPEEKSGVFDEDLDGWLCVEAAACSGRPNGDVISDGGASE